jgi:hypothetical protein
MDSNQYEDSSESPNRNKDDLFQNNIIDTEQSNYMAQQRTETVSSMMWDDPIVERPITFTIRGFLNRDNHTVSDLTYTPSSG